jgi:hypothetical protein
MIWNHRLVRITTREETYLCLCEVFYNDSGQPTGHSEPFMHGDTVEEMEELVRRMGVAVSRPVLDDATDFDNPTDV